MPDTKVKSYSKDQTVCDPAAPDAKRFSKPNVALAPISTLPSIFRPRSRDMYVENDVVPCLLKLIIPTQWHPFPASYLCSVPPHSAMPLWPSNLSLCTTSLPPTSAASPSLMDLPCYRPSTYEEFGCISIIPSQEVVGARWEMWLITIIRWSGELRE